MNGARKSNLILIISFSVALLLRAGLSADPVAGRLESWLAPRPSPAATRDNFPAPADLADADLQAENQRLRAELNFSKRADLKVIGADVVNKSVQPYRSVIRINRGSKLGIKPGQAVLSGGYLIGYVQRADRDQSSVVLIGDPSFRATVVIEGEGLDGIVEAQAGGVVIGELPKSSDEMIGKRVLTSGVGEMFDAGYTVGFVGDELEGGGQDIFKTYILNYPLDIGQLRQVLVVTP